MKTQRNKKGRQNKTKKRIFKNKDFNAPDGFLTSVWGPALWHALHTIRFNYPTNPTDNDKKNYRDFMLSLVNILPCKYCRMNLRKNLKDLPLRTKDLNNRHTFSLWMYKLHEHINKMLGKKSGLTFEKVRERYEHFRSRCTIDIDKKTNMIKIKSMRAKKTRKKKKKKEKGCVEPLYGKKSKCVIKIVPKDKNVPTFQMDDKCKKKRST